MPLVFALGSLVAVGAAAAIALNEEKLAGTNTTTSVALAVAAADSPALAKRGLPSPQTIYATGFEKPEQIKSAFKQQGDQWPKRKLLSFPKRDDRECDFGDSDSNTLYVRYITEYPDNQGGRPTLPYTDIKLPPVGESAFDFHAPQITEVVTRDLYEWQRHYQVHWWYGHNQRWLERLMDRKREIASADYESVAQELAAMREVGMIDQQINNTPVKSLNETIDDRIEVKAPYPGWSFRYNNVTKKGDPPRQMEGRIDYAEHIDKISENLAGITTMLDQFAEVGRRIELGGEREILGHVCEVRRLSEIGFQACIAQINGQSVSLWQRLDKAEQTAVYIDDSPCVPLAQFLPPADIDFTLED